jgi:hypothetical protein
MNELLINDCRRRQICYHLHVKLAQSRPIVKHHSCAYSSSIFSHLISAAPVEASVASHTVQPGSQPSQPAFVQSVSDPWPGTERQPIKLCPQNSLSTPPFLLSNMFFKRLSRGSRANSYAEDEYDSRPRSQDKYSQDKYAQDKYSQEQYDLDDSPRQSALQHNIAPPSPTKETTRDMYSPSTRTSQLPQEPYAQARGLPANNGQTSRQNSAAFEVAPAAPGKEHAPAPDLLTRAFHEAVRPYSEKIEHLEAQLADMQHWVEQLELQRNEMYSWIDKRGLRPGMMMLVK